MVEASNVEVTIAFNDPNLDSEELEAQAQNLLSQLNDLDEIEAVNRVLDPNPPEGNKSVGGFIAGLLMAEVSKENFKKLMGFLGDRLGSKPIKLKVKAPDGRELELEASSQAEFDYAYEKAQEFLNNKPE
jgi:hypothetical protein